ncbi:IS3 family transposase [Psychrobium sp. 1_MG-2023]|uniref:IS3 family transposase n=1 Tax=Psychrobium sp. 1_MG-2023 TaxID=3062624 RepID=UPI002735E3FC|nr:IS3 family transposase [Psychrobium sp. 1_MG-2023]MDP2562984.1 IS3 family transposase [Psychrobium sp. 1_MG-2023]
MTTKRKYQSYNKEFKDGALALVYDQGYSVSEAASAVGITTSLLYSWKQKQDELTNSDISADELAELKSLRKEVKTLRMEKEILKKASGLLCKGNEVKFRYIRASRSKYPTNLLCNALNVSRSAFYDWLTRPAKVISVEELNLYRSAKRLFERSRGSLGSRQLSKNLCDEGFSIGRYATRTVMRKLKLVVSQRQAYKVTTKRKHSDTVADNILNQQFNPPSINHSWAGDVTYLKTHEGWMYLAIVMDLYSRRIIGWSVSKRMTVDLVAKALKMAITLRKPNKGVIFHSDRGSQYTSHTFGRLLKNNGIVASMSSVGACLDNAVVERFFGSLKHEWLVNVTYLTRQSMKHDVNEYIKYYNHERLHTTLGDKTPINYEKLQNEVSGWT